MLADIQKVCYRLDLDNLCHSTTFVVGSNVLVGDHIVVALELADELGVPAIGIEPTVHCKINLAVHSVAVAADHSCFAVVA